MVIVWHKKNPSSHKDLAPIPVRGWIFFVRVIYLPPHIYGFSGGEKKHQVFFPATTEQNIARVNLFRKPSVSFYLMAIVAIVAIHQECIIPVALFNWSVVIY
jgi:hypothetical protein